MKNLLLTLGLLLSYTLLTGQNPAYYRIGPSTIYTKALVKEYDQNPFYRFKLVYNDTTIYKYPDEVDEYMDGKQRYYEAHEILEDEVLTKVFLLNEYQKGDITLYSFLDKHLKNHIFLKTGDDLLRLSERGRGGNQYLRVLTGLFEKCRIEREVRRYTTYDVGAMRRFLKSLDDCQVLYTPVPKFIAKIGIGPLNPSPTFSTVRPSEIFLGPLLSDPRWSNDISYNLSLRYYTPFRKTGVGVEAGLTVARHASQYLFSFDNTTLRMDYSSLRLELPVLFSFSVPRDRWQPLFKFGGALAYSMNSSHPLTEFVTDPFNGGVNRRDTEVTSPSLSYGVGFGAELRHKINSNLGALFGVEYFLFFENGENRLIDANRIDINLGVTYAF